MTEKIGTEKIGTEKKTGSKFSGLMAAVKDRQEDVPEPEEIVQEAYTKHTESMQSESRQLPVSVPSVNPENAVKRGRPRGKRSSDDFVQVTAYVSKETHRAVKIALLGVGEDREFSELVEDLLTNWLQSGR